MLPSLAGQSELTAQLYFAACTGAFGLFRTAYHEGGDNMRLLLDNTLPGKLAPVTGIKQPFESEPHLLASQHDTPSEALSQRGGRRLCPHLASDDLSCLLGSMITVSKCCRKCSLLPPHHNITMHVLHGSQGLQTAHLSRIPAAHAGVQEMLAVAEPMDLSQNVFQDGTWGTLRCACPMLPAAHNGGRRHGLDTAVCLQKLCLLACLLGSGSAAQNISPRLP